tara:strand:+ start:327 stop:2702 length:2376 start_codon:yes stop_codon:yes gene_type:complete
MSVFNSTPPKINKNHLIKWLSQNYSFFYVHKFTLKELNSERDKNYLITLDSKKKFILKIYNSLETKKILDLQDYVLSELNKRSSINKIIPKKMHNKILIYRDLNNSKCFVRLLSYIDGKLFAECKNSTELEISLGTYLGILSNELKSMGHPSAFRKFEWDPSSIEWTNKYIDLFKNKKRTIIEKNLNEFKKFVKKNKKNLRYSLTHGDANNYNLVVSKNKIIGLLDYGDMVFAPTINDLAVSLSYALMNQKNLYITLKNIITSYHKKFSINFDETISLMSLVKSRLTITVIMAERQIKKFPQNKYILISKRDAWNLLYKLDKINIYSFIFIIRDFCNYPFFSQKSNYHDRIIELSKSFSTYNNKTTELIKKRNTYISRNLSISYKKPIQLSEGKYQYLYDNKGKKYLDCVNNISHVGHCHPQIHQSLLRQNLRLNTNTRYVYKIINDYSEKLLNKFPKKLNTIFFVCTGSEANDLAYRISMQYTKANNVLVMDNAYHGHTNSLIDLSPYKFKGKGGNGQKKHVHIAEMPDGIRGKWLYSDKNWINKYINQVKLLVDKINYNKNQLSCFFVESILGCGGQIILPKNYLKEVFKIIRKNNGLCIVDEVQTGFGRVGNNFWAFEEHGVIPDIVTLGKPMGNGHPIAAVVTTKEIASSFNNGMEYFNSFGGNPVSCAIGESVLDIIENENLQYLSNNVGKYLLKSLLKIQKKYPYIISEVRGRGLFIGIDLINNSFNNPNPKLANTLINKMREKGILLSTDGPYNNVIKIKPPIVFNKNDSDLLTYELNEFFKKL